MARNPFREAAVLPSTQIMPIYESFQGDYIPPILPTVMQNPSGPSYVLQDVSLPAPQDITATVAPGSKRTRNTVNYSEVHSAKMVAYSSLVTPLHAGFSSVDTIVQLTNHGNHQWYRSRAYATTTPHSYADIASNDASEEWYKATDDEVASWAC
jgi:hypothetical protein